MVEVQEGGLRPFEQNLALVVHGVVDHADGVADHGLNAGRVLTQVAVRDLPGIER